MSALVYFLVAVLGAALAVRSWVPRHGNPARRAFTLLATLVSVSYVSFSLYLVPGVEPFRVGFAAAAGFLPAATLGLLARFSGPARPADERLQRRLWAATPPVVAGYLAWEVLGPVDAPWPDVALGLAIYGAFALILHRLWRMHTSTADPMARTRLRTLISLLAAALAFSVLEGTVRLVSAPEPMGDGILGRSLANQGVLPPISALIVALLLYTFHQTVTLGRLVDVNESYARVGTVAASAALLVAVDTVALSLLGSTRGPFGHLTYQLFLASALFLIAYDPVRERLSMWMTAWFNPPGHELGTALAHLDALLPRLVTREALARETVAALHAVGRFGSVGLYLLDHDRRQLALVDSRTEGGRAPLPAVTAAVLENTEGSRVLRRSALQRQVRLNVDADEAEARLRLLDALRADLAFPLRSDPLALGLLVVEEASPALALTEEEVGRLASTTGLLSLVLETLSGFDAIKEQHRLAALGTMAAGLAHEIRNPLAGIKGAAQYLQSLPAEGGAKRHQDEFLDIIVTEVDRLNAVVTGFLDYARHLELRRERVDVNVLVLQVNQLVRAGGLPPGIRLREELGGALPTLDADGDKLRQVLLNLLRNAVQAVGHEGTVVVSTRRGQLRLRSGAWSSAVEVVVADDGPGIPKENRDKLFIPFFTTKDTGTGLGLAISQRIARAHEGELEVESRPGEGSRFIVRLPVGLGDVSVEEGRAAG